MPMMKHSCSISVSVIFIGTTDTIGPKYYSARNGPMRELGHKSFSGSCDCSYNGPMIVDRPNIIILATGPREGLGAGDCRLQWASSSASVKGSLFIL